MNHAISLASSNPLRSTVRLNPAEYFTSIHVSSGTFKIVGTGATLSAAEVGGQQFLRGSDVSIRGLHFDLSRGAMYCGSGRTDTTPLGGTLRLRDLTITSANQSSLFAQGCVLSATQVVFEGLDAPLLFVEDDSEFMADRSSFVGKNGSNTAYLLGRRVSLSITNSVFDEARLVLDPRDVIGSTSRAVFAFNTVVLHRSLALYRENPASTGNTGTFLTFIENNVLLATTATSNDAVDCTGCSVAHNIVFPQVSALPSSNQVTDPKLVAPDSHDFHLAAGSPALNAAVPSLGISTDHDFEGTLRPQGAQIDIGAYERKP
ncbi:MAG: hypothetical protein IPQ07_13215 [Myxococcales bacterium]|nr:hypothetical protein [Myxococcales bacterium]